MIQIEKMKKAKDFKMEPNDAHTTELSIVQDFPKKKAASFENGSHDIEMIQK